MKDLKTARSRTPIKVTVRVSRAYDSDILYVGDDEYRINAVPDKIRTALASSRGGVSNFDAPRLGFDCDIELDAEGVLYTVPQAGDRVVRCLTNASYAGGRQSHVTAVLGNDVVTLDCSRTCRIPLDGDYTIYKICE